MKIPASPPEKCHLPFSQHAPSKSWGPVNPPLFENLVGGSTPFPKQKGHFFKKSQHPKKWSASFKNFFRSCDLPIASNLLKMSLRKTSLFLLNLTGVIEKSILLAVIPNYCCNNCDQNPWKISVKEFSFRAEFLETLCKYIYLGF